MSNKKKDNPIAVYAVASQIGFIVLVPLLVFVIGGSWLVSALGWPQWINIIFVVVGIITMAVGAWRYLKKLLALFDTTESGAGASEVRHKPKDHDYYDSYSKKKKL